MQDAYEEVEEQRAVAAQWKRKLQKLTNDMADLRSLLDEQVIWLLFSLIDQGNLAYSSLNFPYITGRYILDEFGLCNSFHI